MFGIIRIIIGCVFFAITAVVIIKSNVIRKRMLRLEPNVK